MSFDDYDTDRSGEIDMGEFIRLARFMRLDPDKEYVCVHVFIWNSLRVLRNVVHTCCVAFVCLFVCFLQPKCVAAGYTHDAILLILHSRVYIPEFFQENVKQ